MKTRDIEDVLNSIRRLVTEENAVARAARMDRLVLTPALRILPPPAPVQDEPPPVEPEAGPIGIEAAILQFATPQAPGPKAESEAAAGEPSLEERIATLEAAISRSGDDFEPDGSEDLGTLTAESIAFPPAEGARAPEPAPAEPPEAAESPRAFERPQAAEPAAAAEPPPATHRAPAVQAGTSLEEALIDEDSLREIVSHLVREELRGELGERITRNVRRLIRREIAQALALKDLESED